MLTGDHKSSAWRVANAVGINEVHCSLKPEDKLNHVTNIPRNTGDFQPISQPIYKSCYLCIVIVLNGDIKLNLINMYHLHKFICALDIIIYNLCSIILIRILPNHLFICTEITYVFSKIFCFFVVTCIYLHTASFVFHS